MQKFNVQKFHTFYARMMTFFNGDAFKLGILKKRVDMPDAIMELFSPIKNPLFNIVSTITKQVSEMETMAFKAEAVAMLNGSMLFDKLSVPAGKEDLYSEEIRLKYSNEVFKTTTYCFNLALQSKGAA